MNSDKHLKAGYQGRPDAMRTLAEKLMGPPLKPEKIKTPAAMDKIPMRIFKEGGAVKKREEDKQAMERHQMERGGMTPPEKLIGMLKDQEEGRMTNVKKGGAIKKSATSKKTKECSKFAMGGVAKIRHDQATPSGKPKNPKKTTTKGSVYY